MECLQAAVSQPGWGGQEDLTRRCGRGGGQHFPDRSAITGIITQKLKNTCIMLKFSYKFLLHIFSTKRMLFCVIRSIPVFRTFLLCAILPICMFCFFFKFIGARSGGCLKIKLLSDPYVFNTDFYFYQLILHLPVAVLHGRFSCKSIKLVVPVSLRYLSGWLWRPDPIVAKYQLYPPHCTLYK